MEQIQEHDNSIYYVHNNKLIEFNLITKNKYIHKQMIKYLTYHVCDRNTIFYQGGGNLYLNNTTLSRTNHQIVIMQTPNKKKYILCGIDDLIKIYDLTGHLIKTISNPKISIKTIPLPHLFHIDCFQYDVSSDGKIITWEIIGDFNNIFILNLNNNLDMIVTTISLNTKSYITTCVYGSSRLVILGCPSLYIINIQTMATISKNDKSKYFETNTNTMIRLGPEIIEIYNADTLNTIKQIQHKYEFIHYHKKLDILITTSFQLFVITTDYKLKRSNIGINYAVDQNTTPILIMDIIMDYETLLDFISYDILLIELYQQILKHVINP